MIVLQKFNSTQHQSLAYGMDFAMQYFDYFYLTEDGKMLIEKYEQEGLLFNMNFIADGSNGEKAYRGELIIIEGEIADAQGRRKPPVAIIRHAILLEKDGKLVLAAGFIDKLELLEAFVEKYGADFSPEMKSLIYVVNITKPMQVEVSGVNFVLMPLTDGIAWNELTEELGLEKSDFKGKSTGDKVVTVYEEMGSYSPKYDSVADFAAAMSFTADIQREDRGPV